MKKNGQEWYRNIQERAGMTPQRREKTLVQRQNKPQKHQNAAVNVDGNDKGMNLNSTL